MHMNDVLPQDLRILRAKVCTGRLLPDSVLTRFRARFAFAGSESELAPTAPPYPPERADVSPYTLPCPLKAPPTQFSTGSGAASSSFLPSSKDAELRLVRKLPEARYVTAKAS